MSDSPFGSERIVAAAVRLDGEVFSLPAPNRHWNVMTYMRQYLGDKWREPDPDWDQGFLTSKGRFVRRIEARDIAMLSGQIEKTQHRNQLFSEDVW
jgi:hypothetical protein